MYLYVYVCVGDSSHPLARSQEGLQPEKLNHIAMLDVLGHDNETGNGICALGGGKRGKSPP